jgi:hypothetical protein
MPFLSSILCCANAEDDASAIVATLKVVAILFA